MMSLIDFFEYIQDGSNPPRCILELLPGLPSSDPIIEYVRQTRESRPTHRLFNRRLSDGHLVTRTRFFKDTLEDYDMLPSDVWRTFDWCLLHQRGFFTMPHFDAMGLGTSVQVRGKGRKMWIILRFTPPSIATFANLAERMKHVVAGASKYGASRGDFHIPNSDWNIGPDNGAILVLEEGDLLYVVLYRELGLYTPNTILAYKHPVRLTRSLPQRIALRQESIGARCILCSTWSSTEHSRSSPTPKGPTTIMSFCTSC